MRQLHGEKECVSTRGGLADGGRLNSEAAVTTNCKKSAEAIVASFVDRLAKGRIQEDEGQ